MPRKNRDAVVKENACSMGRPVAPSLFPLADPANRRAEHVLLRRSGLEWFIALIVLLCIIVARGATTESVGHFATFICVVCVASLLTLSLSKPCERTEIDCDCATGRVVLRPSRRDVPSPPPSPPTRPSLFDPVVPSVPWLSRSPFSLMRPCEMVTLPWRSCPAPSSQSHSLLMRADSGVFLTTHLLHGLHGIPGRSGSL